MDWTEDDEEWLPQQGWSSDSRSKQPMRHQQGVHRRPSKEDLKVRRRNRRAAAGGDVQTRAELVRAAQKAGSLAEAARLWDEVKKLDDRMAAQASMGRELDFAQTVVGETLSPVRVHEHHTAATDWMGYEDAVDPQWQNRVVAEAAMWFGRVPEFVKQDSEEFGIQAAGKARQIAGQFGLQAEAARQTFTNYVSFLNTQAASGLDQIQQTVDPHDNPKTTPLPTEVFDTFAPEVDPINAGVSGTEDSNRNPLLQEIVNGGSGMNPGQPEKPGGHSVDDELSWAPPQGMQQDSTAPLNYAEGPSNSNPPPAPVRQQASLVPPPGMAISHTMTMDEYRAQQRTAKAADALGKCTGCGKGLSVANAADREGKVCKTCASSSTDRHASKKEAGWPFGKKPEPAQQAAPAQAPAATKSRAELFDDYMRSEDASDAFDKIEDHRKHGCPKGCPGAPNHGADELLNNYFGPGQPGPSYYHSSRKEAASSLDQVQQTVDPHDNPKPTGLPPEVAFPLDGDMQEEWSTNGTGNAAPSGKAAARKQADMYGGGDAPHAVVQPDVANNATTTPPTAQNAGGAAAGRADAQAGNAPSFADDSFGVPTPAQQYPEGYGSMDPAANTPKDVPSSMTAAKVSSLIVTAAERENPDFRKGYGYGTKWTPGTRLVSTGSKEFEAGLYAGISDNAKHQKAFVEAHRAIREKFPKIAARADQHKRVTARVVSKNEVPSNGLYLSVEAASGLDLATTAPNTTPAADGSTPINGKGSPGPLDGQQDAAAPGGPSPYNGAEPFGSPVVPGAGQTPASPADALIGGGHMSTTNQILASQALAFRQRVQSSLLAERKGK